MATETSIAITPSPVSIAVGATAPLTLTATYDDNSQQPATATTWSALPTTIATVSQTGVVTAVSPGVALISADVEGVGVSFVATVEVTVTAQ